MVSQPFSAVLSDGREGVTVVSFSGDIDLTAEPEVRRALADATGADAPRAVVDLSRVSFMDSTGFNLLIDAHLRATARNGWVRVATLPPVVQHVFRALSLDEVISAYPTLGEALAA
ncbi:STAS domain-containing protein [Streptomyces sp. TG1A-8]|uniref:STAS domain-containing protein n=1 Tax=Streptomyces sp. TG1A-8 TaxID=3051385 RepID=UPI00265C873B|nr:STAS domain-containing protein [Streptomyces sp. TG1A-8]MDO0924723.1 STAS domain-containing protein [Streptomyces sp. TG1A-8]